MKETNTGYIPQDHVIHSINLYILGIYLFFNYPLFHKRLIDTLDASMNLKQSILLFIKKWRNFSLYHDIGYSIETLVDKNGCLQNKIKNPDLHINENIAYLYTMRIFSRVIIDTALIEKESKEFDVNTYIDSYNYIWKNKNGDKVVKNTIKKKLSTLENPILLKTIESDYGFNNILPLLNNKEYMVIINDEFERPLGIILKRNFQTIESYYNDSLSTNLIESNSRNTIYHYVIQKSQDYLSAFHDNNPYRVLGLHEYLPRKFKQNIELLSSDIQFNALFFQIFEWICSETYNSILGNFKEKYNTNLTSCYLDAIKNYMCSIISFNDEIIDSKEKLKNAINRIIMDIKNNTNNSNMANIVYEKGLNNYLCENGASFDIIMFCNDINKNLNQLISNSESTSIDFIKIFDKSIIAELFVHESTDEFGEELYNMVSQKCERLKISISDICSYKTDYSSCDHGLISAGIFFQATIVSSYIINKSKSDPRLLLAWNPEDIDQFFSKKSIENYADVIFAILWHNIYTKSSKTYGIEYTQKINIDAFSYFCAFCDNLQKWNRPKQVDISKVNVPNHHFLNNDFDLIVDANHITLFCNESDIDYIKNEIENLDTFLQGASNIIQLKII